MRINWIYSRVRTLALALAAVALSGAMISCNNDDDDNASQPQTITDLVVAGDQFTILEAAVVKAGLADALRQGSLTVFAPTDAAFQEAGIPNAAAVTNSTTLTAAVLTDILQYHVINQRVPAANIPTANNTAQPTIRPTNGTVFITKTSGGAVTVNGARVVQADVPASNGVIHVIDKVLMPPTGDLVQTLTRLNQQTPNTYNLILAAAQRAGANVLATLQAQGPFTVFIPTNAAITASNPALTSEAAINAVPVATLQSILTYHVVPGRVFSTDLTTGNVATAQTGTVAVNVGTGGVTLTGRGNGTNASRVTAANIVATNGVIHVIDRMLLP